MADVLFSQRLLSSVFAQNSEEQKEIISASHGKKESEGGRKERGFLGKPKTD